MSIHIDPTYGHVTIHEDGRYPNGHYATIVDLGDVCQIDVPKWVDHLNTEQATELGSALIGWASRKRLAARAARAKTLAGQADRSIVAGENGKIGVRKTAPAGNRGLTTQTVKES